MADVRQSKRYRELRARLRAEAESKGERCAINGCIIDYKAPPRHPSSWTLDHIKPVATHPELALDPANMQSACWSCNAAKNTREDTYGLGRRRPRLS